MALPGNGETKEDGGGVAVMDRVSILEKFPQIAHVIHYRLRLEENRVDTLRCWHGARAEPELQLEPCSPHKHERGY